MTEQLTFAFPAQHVTAVYRLTRDVHPHWRPLTDSPYPWWSWRCLCGTDMGRQARGAYSHQVSAEEMAWHHRHDREPALNPSPGPGVARCHAGPGCPCGGGTTAEAAC